MHTRLGLQLALGCLLALAACSGDDANENAADAGAKDASNGSAAGGGGKGTGSGKEGVDCASNADCGSGLSCLKADERDPNFKVCARPCLKNSECKDGERCWSTGEPEDGLCWNIEDEALKSCGPAFTALCDTTKNLGCLRIEDKGSISGGVCLEPCKLKADDACSDGFSCLDILDQQNDGLCVHTVGRGEVCDEPKGEFCEPGNLCLSDGASSWRCYQDCSESKQCDDDKMCKDLQGDQGAYCE